MIEGDNQPLQGKINKEQIFDQTITDYQRPRKIFPLQKGDIVDSEDSIRLNNTFPQQPGQRRTFTRQPVEWGKVAGRKEARDDAGGGSDREAGKPLSPLETLLQTQPDISVCRSNLGDLRIAQQVKTGVRLINIDVERERGTESRYPTVSISAVNTSVNGHFTSVINLDEERGRQFKYGVVTKVKIHTDNDETVKAEVEYTKGEPMPPDMHPLDKYYTKLHARPIPAYELVTVARSGLEMLKAYIEASEDERERIDSTYKGWFDHGDAQILDGLRPDRERERALAAPVFFQAIMPEIDRLQYVGGNTFFAFNTLGKVTDAMLPSEMPPAPKNRKEPARRTRPPRR